MIDYAKTNECFFFYNGVVLQYNRIEWNGMEWNGMEWNGMEGKTKKK